MGTRMQLVPQYSSNPIQEVDTPVLCSDKKYRRDTCMGSASSSALAALNGGRI